MSGHEPTGDHDDHLPIPIEEDGLFARDLNLHHKFSPEVSAYWDRLSARPAFLAAKAAQGPANPVSEESA